MPGKGRRENLHAVHGRKGGAKKREQADSWYILVMPGVVRLRAEGHTLKQLAEKLNRLGVKTQRGGEWTHVQVLRLLRRAKRLGFTS
jgi:hypothetical protein